MAIKRLDRSFSPTNKEINYLMKTMPQFKQGLVDFARVYYKDSYNDFNETSPGMMFIEMASVIGDVLSFYIDNQFKENLIQYTENVENIISIAQSMGYKPKPITTSAAEIDVYQLVPSTGVATNYIPDSRYFLRIKSNAAFSTEQAQLVSFRSVEELNFADPTGRDITVYSTDAFNNPSMYLVKKKVKVSSGVIKEYKVTFGSPESFSKIVLPDPNVTEIIDVTDSSGYTWSEVDYLAQDLILDSRENTNPNTTSGVSVPPTYTIRVTRTPRRFVTRYNSDFELELHFGSGVLSDTDETINLDPRKIANSEYQGNLASNSLDPSDFLSSRSYGLAPSNVVLTIRYASGGGIDSNAPSNTITKINDVQVLNDRNSFATQLERDLFNDVVASLAVNNSSPATGGKDGDTVEEIRLNSLAFFNSQNRLVNAQDYVVRSYAMPPKFGGIAKSFVAQNEQIASILKNNNTQAPASGTFVDNRVGQNIVNLYVLGYDQNKNLVTLNPQTKENLRKYLDQYRMLTDEIRIIDGFVVNIGVEFKIVVFKNYNMEEVLTRSIDAIKNFFDVDRWQINQPIIMNDLYLEIARIDGVQTVLDLKITNKYRYKDGLDYQDYLYDIGSATINGVIYPSLDPCIFEVRYPNSDIVGSAIQ